MGYQRFFPASRYFLSKSSTTPLFIKKRCLVLHYIFKKNFTLSSEKNEEILAWYRHEMLYWKYVSSISRFINYLYCWIYNSYILHKNWTRFFRNQIGLLFHFEIKICSYSFSFVVTLPVISCHSLSLAITRCSSLSFVVIRYRPIYHSLSFVVTRCTTDCRSLSLVVIRCTTGLSFYKRSFWEWNGYHILMFLYILKQINEC